MNEYLQTIAKKTGGVTVFFDPDHSPVKDPTVRIAADLRDRLEDTRWELMNSNSFG